MPMLISEFARATGLSVDTVRFYVREGLLHPKTGARGASRPYLEFSDLDARLAAGIRIGQALGMSLAEMRSLLDERRAGRLSRQRSVQAMRAQRERLVARQRELRGMLAYMDAKIEWMQGEAPEPSLPDYLAQASTPEAAHA